MQIKKIGIFLTLLMFFFGFIFVSNSEAVSKKELDERLTAVEFHIDASNEQQKKQQENVEQLLKENANWKTRSEKAEAEYQELKKNYQALEQKHYEVLEKLSAIESKVTLLAEASKLESQINSLSGIGDSQKE